ncbi:MAG: hypothetical protein ACFFDT_34440 [Candidatus Hodarchaeota archaeon]
MDKIKFDTKVLCTIIVVLTMFGVAAFPVNAAAEDEIVDFSLTPALNRKAVAMAPDFDYPGVTINSGSPANISWRDMSNNEKSSFDVLKEEKASLKYPINTPIDINPVTTSGKRNYADTTWLIFENNSEDSFSGSFNVSTTHQAIAMDDNEKLTFRVEPDYNLHLRIVAGSNRPISVRLNTFPNKAIGSRYDKVIILDPDGFLINPYKYVYGTDEYFIFIAQRSGKYAMLFDPIGEPLYYTVETKTYKPKTLKISEEFEPEISGLSDSELSTLEAMDNPLTFDWFKFTPKEQQVVVPRFEVSRAKGPASPTLTPASRFFTPGVNTTIDAGSYPFITVGSEDNLPSYMMYIHDGFGRFMAGVEEYIPESLEVGKYLFSKLTAQEYAVYSFNVSSTASYRLALLSENQDIKKIAIGSVTSESYEFRDISLVNAKAGIEADVHKFFATPGDYLILIQNTGNQERTLQMVLDVENTAKTKDFKQWTNIDDITDPDARVDAALVALLKTPSLPGIPKSAVLTYTSTWEQERFNWLLEFGWIKSDSLELNGANLGDTIRFIMDYTILTKIDGELTVVAEETFNLQGDDLGDNENKVLLYPATMTSDDGFYWVILDTLVINMTGGSNTNYLPYDFNIRFDIFDKTDFYLDKTATVTFSAADNTSAILTNYNFNTSRYYFLLVKVPVEWLNWTEVIVHYLNGTYSDEPHLCTDIMNVYGPDAGYDENMTINDYTRTPDPSALDEIANITFAFGSATNRSYIFLWFNFDQLTGVPDPDPEIVKINMTFTRIPTYILNLAKETKVKPKGAPGFEFLFGALGLGTLVLLATRKRNKSKKS